MNYLLSYMSYTSNYNVVNIINMHNFNYTIMQTLDENERKAFINTMILTIGTRYTSDFRLYIFKKIPDSILLTYF